MNVGDHQGKSSEDEMANNSALQPQTFATPKTAFDAAFVRLQAEVDQEAEVKVTRRSNPDPRAHLASLLRAAAEKIITLIVEADQAWHAISNAVSGQTWGETNSEAKQAVGKLKRDFQIMPFSKIESRVEMSCKCLMSALEEEPKQHVMWYEADKGAPSFEEGCEMDWQRLTILMDAATDRLSPSESKLENARLNHLLGVTKWQQGKFTEARNLHQRALHGYTKIRGSDHPDTFNAMSKLAAVHTKKLAFAEAIDLQDQAVGGFRKQRGPGHEDTMVASKELGMKYLERVIHRQGQQGDLNQAFQIMQEVVMQRKQKSGKEHGLTLWAIADFARVKNARGEHSEAEADFRAGLLIVEQNFGEDHIGTLYGKTYFSHVLISGTKYDEAEQILVRVIGSHRKLRPNHPDQLVGLSFLLK